jgi:predicted nuclease of predicted toxin-antitoxin system
MKQRMCVILGLQGAKDREIAAYARSEGLCLLTGEFDFSNVRNYPPKQYSGIVV